MDAIDSLKARSVITDSLVGGHGKLHPEDHMPPIDSLKDAIKQTNVVLDPTNSVTPDNEYILLNQACIMHALVDLLERGTVTGLCIHCGEKTEGLACLQCAPTVGPHPKLGSG